MTMSMALYWWRGISILGVVLGVMHFSCEAQTRLHKLHASDGAPYDSFGLSVAMTESRILVGAYGDDDSQSYSGSAYVFDPKTGEEVMKLRASDGRADAFFGSSVALCGNTALIGAYGDHSNGYRSGAAYLFDLETGGEVRLNPSDSASYDNFGASVAVSGEFAVVGAPYDDIAGSVYLFDLAGVELHKLLPKNGSDRDHFGRAVAVSGRLVVVGSPSSRVGSSTGSVSVFDAITGALIQELEPAGEASYSTFWSICGDIRRESGGRCDRAKCGFLMHRLVSRFWMVRSRDPVILVDRSRCPGIR